MTVAPKNDAGINLREEIRMKETPQNHPVHARLVTVTGKLPTLSATNRNRLAVYLVQNNTVLSQSQLNSTGTFQFHVAPHLATAHAGVSVVLGPKGLDPQSLASHTDLPRAALASTGKQVSGAIDIDFTAQKISDDIIDRWWFWCREYTVSGTLETSTNCPVGAQVTIYNVNCGVSGLVKTPITTVTTDANGNFTASFNWCSRICWWPCWPVWWRCWPWWWELDILAVIENVERQLQIESPANAIVAPTSAAPLRQPDGADLMTGVGFAATRATAIQPDKARTALIARKFADPRIRERFPYWWWCCENPNLVFSAAQGETTILNEDPNTSTRWCFASGQTVPLTGNAQAVGACPVQQGSGDCAFVWNSVGSDPAYSVLFENILSGYDVPGQGGDCVQLAFNGELNLYGLLTGDCVAYYQVLASQWNSNPARGGSDVGAFQPLSETLVNTVTIWRGALPNPYQEQVSLVLGPFSFNGQDNLYTTPYQRQSGLLPASVIAQIGAFPTLGPSDILMGWSSPDLVLSVQAADLVSPAAAGGVTLAYVPYDATGTAIPTPSSPTPPQFVLGPDLTLMIDTTPLTTANIGTVTVYNSDGTLANQTTVPGTTCLAYQITTATGYALITTSVSDTEGHLCAYSVTADFGHDLSGSTTPTDREYTDPLSSFTPNSALQAYGIDAGYVVPNTLPTATADTPPIPAWSFIGGGDVFLFNVTQSCCYDFRLAVAKRTTDGDTFACASYTADFQTVNITIVS
jgi:hypothetical protein